MNYIVIHVIMCFSLLVSGDKTDKANIIDMPGLLPLARTQFDDHREALKPQKMKVCDNFVTSDIKAKFGASAVRKAANTLIEWINKHPINSTSAFKGAWRDEFRRVTTEMPMVKRCKSFTKFGTNYDETKFFCAPDLEAEECHVFSIGSNNIWDFEVAMHQATKCRIDAFDCTVSEGAGPPKNIQQRTTLHRTCLASKPHKDVHVAHDAVYSVTPRSVGLNSIDAQTVQFTSVPGLNKLARAPEGATYFKMDIEGFEWSILKGMVRWASANHLGTSMDSTSRHAALPKQIFAEFHLDRDVTLGNKYSMAGQNVGMRLRHFVDEMFLRGGYMVMFNRPTAQTRNRDILFVKVLCPI